jgi:hypothetical protein
MRRYKTPEQLKAWREKPWSSLGKCEGRRLIEAYMDDGKLMLVYTEPNGDMSVVPWERPEEQSV